MFNNTNVLHTARLKTTKIADQKEQRREVDFTVADHEQFHRRIRNTGSPCSSAFRAFGTDEKSVFALFIFFSAKRFGLKLEFPIVRFQFYTWESFVQLRDETEINLPVMFQDVQYHQHVVINKIGEYDRRRSRATRSRDRISPYKTVHEA